tara:strand:- start:8249 stop:8848 length:600 start_codon:yes stop_codon:yes gene_type:complete
MIIRHARSLYNIDETVGLDEGLTPYGHDQADMAGHFLRDEFGDDYWNIATSPFLRCLQTSQHIKNYLDCECVVDGRLGEMTIDYHKLESLDVSERREVFSKMDWDNYNFHDFAHETMSDYLVRLESAWEDTPNRSIIVTHGSPVLSFIRMHEGTFNSVPLWDFSIGNCSMTWIRGKRIVWRTRELFWEKPYKNYDRKPK